MQEIKTLRTFYIISAAMGMGYHLYCLKYSSWDGGL